MIDLKKATVGVFIFSLLYCFLISSLAFAQEDEICPPSTLPGNYNIDPFVFDPAGNIEPVGCVDITILRGHPPYHWFSDDPEFILMLNDQGATNQICLSESACGAAEITVTWNLGLPSESTETTYVRSDSGKWVLVPDDCPIPGPANEGSRRRIQGKWHVYQTYVDCAFCSSGGANCEPCGPGRCSAHCADHLLCIDFTCPKEAPEKVIVDGHICCQGGCDGEGCKNIRCYQSHYSLKLYEWQCN